MNERTNERTTKHISQTSKYLAMRRRGLARSARLVSARRGPCTSTFVKIEKNRVTNKCKEMSQTSKYLAVRARRWATLFPIWRDRDDEVEALRGNLFERSAAKYFDILCAGDVDAALCEENPNLALIRRRVPIEFNEKERMDFARRDAQLDPGR